MAEAQAPTSTQGRVRLTRDRVLDGAIVLADEVGMEGFTIRKLATALDVKPMTIYHHVPNKEAIIDGMIDLIFSEIDPQLIDGDWKAAIRHRARSARAVLGRHPWATALMESRVNPGPATLAHHNAVLGCLRRAGFSIEMTAHAYALIDSYVYGFSLQEANMPATAGQDMAELAKAVAGQFPADDYPHLAELTFEHVLKPGYDFSDEFEFGLSLILDGLGNPSAP